MTENGTSVDSLLKQGDTLCDAGAVDDAIRVYQQVVETHPEEPKAYFKLGVAACRRDSPSEAEGYYRQALALWPTYPQAANNLAILLADRGQFDEAEALYRVALAEQPDYCEPHINLGNLLVDTPRRQEALYFLRRAVSIDPNSALARAGLGHLLKCMGRVQEAIGELEIATRLNDSSSAGWNTLGICFYSIGRHVAAEQSFRKALACDRPNVSAWHNILLVSNYSSKDRVEVFQLHQSYGQLIRDQCATVGIAVSANHRAHARCLRIGIVSGDMRHHAVSYFVERVLPELVAQGFQLFAYFNYPQEDDRSECLKPFFYQWRSTHRKDDLTVVEEIRADKIDILLDLSGHTSHNRLAVFGYKPAPVQVTWIGYPNTTGMDTIDYRLTDSYADPEGEADSFYTEKLWRLPGCFLCYSPPVSAPEVAPTPCLSNRCITFGSFNSRVKLGEECLDLWCRVLDAVPDSRLLIKTLSGLADPAEQQSLRDQFTRRGIAEQRLLIQVAVDSFEKHLESYRDVDIALDSYPYHGTTTTCEALWMGVPVVTLSGDRHASRVGVSILSNAGLPELVGENTEQFVEIARGLASDFERLAVLRGGMRERLSSSVLFNANAMGQNLGQAFREMWEHYCSVRALDLADTLPEDSKLPARLRIGGQGRVDGWCLFDAIPCADVDFDGDMRNLSRFSNETYSEIYCSHHLQRLGLTEILKWLKEVRRIMQPGGKLYISVPDMDVLAWLYGNPRVEKMDKFQLMRVLFGGQTNEFDFNLMGFSLDFMVDYLAQAGFASVEQVPSFGLFNDPSDMMIAGIPISLNLVVEVTSPE